MATLPTDASAVSEPLPPQVASILRPPTLCFSTAAALVSLSICPPSIQFSKPTYNSCSLSLSPHIPRGDTGHSTPGHVSSGICCQWLSAVAGNSWIEGEKRGCNLSSGFVFLFCSENTVWRWSMTSSWNPFQCNQCGTSRGSRRGRLAGLTLPFLKMTSAPDPRQPAHYDGTAFRQYALSLPVLSLLLPFLACLSRSGWLFLLASSKTFKKGCKTQRLNKGYHIWTNQLSLS